MPRSTLSSLRPMALRSPSAACATSCCNIDTHYQYYKRDGNWNYEPVKTTKRVADGSVDIAVDKPGAHFAAGEFRPLPARSLERRSERAGDIGCVRRRLLRRIQCRHAGHARDRARQGRVCAGDNMTVAVTARSAGRLTINVVGDRLLATKRATSSRALRR